MKVKKKLGVAPWTQKIIAGETRIIEIIIYVLQSAKMSPSMGQKEYFMVFVHISIAADWIFRDIPVCQYQQQWC